MPLQSPASNFHNQRAFLCDICSLGRNSPGAGFNIVSPLSFLPCKKYRSQQLALVEKQTAAKTTFSESGGPVFKDDASALTVRAGTPVLQPWAREAEPDTGRGRAAALAPQPGPAMLGLRPTPGSLKAAVSKG